MTLDGAHQNRFSSVFKQLTEIAGALGYAAEPDTCTVPNRDGILDLLQDLRSILFPGYFRPSHNGLDAACKLEHLGVIYWRLAGQFTGLCTPAVRVCDSQGAACPIMEKSCQLAMEYLQKLPEIQAKLMKDVQAAYDGDPAATSLEEIILSYPGVYAVTVYRLAHEFCKMGLVLIARIMSEHAHSSTGIDIHPGAEIGESFFIDHGTGVVIGGNMHYRR